MTRWRTMPNRVVIRIILFLAVSWPVAATAIEPPVTCAIIIDPSLKDSPLASLLQDKLSGGNTRFVERDEVATVLAEQKLAAAFAADGGTARVHLGALLRADVLILLRITPSHVPGRGPAVDVVVCETHLGLRLAALIVATEKDVTRDPVPAVAALEPIISGALLKSRNVREVAAVPPFVSNDLSYRFESRKAVYAKLVERVLLEQPGILVVELEEARAIAREAAVAGAGAVRRPLPLYFLGEFRHAGDADSSVVSFKLALRRGERTLEEASLPNTPLSQAPSALSSATGRALAAIMREPAVPADAASQARQLNERATIFQRAGNWEESLALVEASLLVQPDQSQPRQTAVFACKNLAHRSAIAIAASAQRMQSTIDYYTRGLEHLEVILRSAPELRSGRDPAEGELIDRLIHTGDHLLAKDNPSKDLQTAVVAGRRQVTQILLRIGQMRRKDGHRDALQYESWATLHLPHSGRFDLIVKLIEEWGNEPGVGQRVAYLATKAGALDSLSVPARDFVAKLGASENSELRAVAASLRRQRENAPAARAALKNEQSTWDSDLFRKREVERVARAVISAIPSFPEVMFRPVQFTEVGAAGEERLTLADKLIPCGPGIDVAWRYQKIYLIKEAGKLKPVWQTTQPNVSPLDVVFDGKYLWASLRRANLHPQLLVIDPVSEQVWELAAEEGLPLSPAADPGRDKSSSEYIQDVRVAPLGPGRACVVGHFGRTWLAIVEFDPDKGPGAGKTAKIFHEAREQPDASDLSQWQRTTVSFNPGRLLTVGASAAASKDGKAHQSIIVERFDLNINGFRPPLLVDAQSLSVEVPTGGSFPRPKTYVADRLTTQTVARNVFLRSTTNFQERLLFYRGRWMILAENGWITDTPHTPFHQLRGEIPNHGDWQQMANRPGGPGGTIRDDVEHITDIWFSNHYGLLSLTEGSRGRRSIYAVEFPYLEDR